MMPSGPMQGQQGGGGDQQAAIRQQLMQLLTQAAQVAQQNGVDFRALLTEFLQGGQTAPPPAPPRAP